MKKLIYTDLSLMPFGNFKHKALVEVPAWYLLQIYEENKFKKSEKQQALKVYIEANIEVLQKEKKEDCISSENNLDYIN